MKRSICLALQLIIQCSLCLAAHAFTANDGKKTVATDGGISDTQAAIDYVGGKAEDGWIVTIGRAGRSYDWESALSVSIGHAITIQGASSSSRPTITSTVAGDGGIKLTLTDDKLVTIKDLAFGEFTADSLIRAFGSGADTFRFTNLLFNHATAKIAVKIGGVGGGATLTVGAAGPYGVIDNCVVDGGGAAFYFFEVGENWRRPHTWGTKYAFYVEACTFTSTTRSVYPALDGWAGCRVVFRHNACRNYYFGTHGPDTAGLLNSALQHEVLDNTFVSADDVNGTDTFILIKGGTAVIRGNTYGKVGLSWTNIAVKLGYHRSEGSQYVAVDRVYPADYVGTMQPGSGYIGETGRDPKYPDEPWGSVPIYYWDNTANMSFGYGEIGGGGEGFINRDRDYFLTGKPGYTEYAYPHPLRSIKVPPADAAPSSPSNLRIFGAP